MTSITLSTDLSDPALAYTVLPSVGHTYEVAVNGVGYMLADDDEVTPDVTYKRQTVPLNRNPLVMTQDTFSESIDRYSFAAYSDFSGGAGQSRFDRPISDASRYFTSTGVDPFTTPGQLTLLNALSSYTLAYDGLREVVVGTRKFVQTAAATLTYYDTPGSAATGTVTLPGSPGTIVDLTTDGKFWYAACGAGGIFRGTTTVDGGAAWGAELAAVIGFALDRIVIAYPSTGTAPNRVRTLTDAGAVDQTLITLDAGETVTNFTGGAGKLYFGAYAGNEGVIYVWGGDATASPSVSVDRIAGLAPRRVFYYQHQVVARYERRKSSTEADATIYRCPISDSDGSLTPFFVVRLSDSTFDHGPGEFGADDRFVYFTWRGVGLGVIDLSTGGYARSYGATTDKVGHIAGLWQNRMTFSIDQTAAYYVNPAAYVTTGSITTSLSDKASVLDKILDFLTITCFALASGESVSLEWSEDLLSWTSVTDGSLSTTGATSKVIAFGKKASAIALRVTIAGGGSTTPTLTLAQVRLHVHGLADTLVQMPISCADSVADLQGHTLNDAAHGFPGSGAARTRTLEALAQTRVLLQDVDYPTTQTAETYEVVSVDVSSRAVYNPSLGFNQLMQVATVTFRKASK